MHIILKVILHLFFWTVFFLLSGANSFRLAEGTGYLVQHLWLYLSGVLWAASSFYYFYFFLYRYIEQHRFVRYLVLSFIFVIGISVLFIAFYRLVVFPNHFNEPVSWNFTTTFGTYVIASCGSLLRGFVVWIESVGQKEELLKRNLQLELDALRSQVNPHFLFNTLNNIDALIRTQPRKASEMLITLSDVMRYMLYQTKAPTVTLEMESKHLQNVIALHRVRFQEPDYISFHTEITDPGQTIAPLLLLPFVENACKYTHPRKQQPSIVVSMCQTQNRLSFQCLNGYDNAETPNEESGGIGLENVMKRLQLLYPGKHQLEMSDRNREFSVRLTIELF
ncbi:MAG: putative signal transduction histidine kinase [Bacteroidetes bacterium]|nr:putative signal transduction histidine kinase [Bacteroidota bacterium]